MSAQRPVKPCSVVAMDKTNSRAFLYYDEEDTDCQIMLSVLGDMPELGKEVTCINCKTQKVENITRLPTLVHGNQAMTGKDAYAWIGSRTDDLFRRGVISEKKYKNQRNNEIMALKASEPFKAPAFQVGAFSSATDSPAEITAERHHQLRDMVATASHHGPNHAPASMTADEIMEEEIRAEREKEKMQEQAARIAQKTPPRPTISRKDLKSELSTRDTDFDVGKDNLGAPRDEHSQPHPFDGIKEKTPRRREDLKRNFRNDGYTEDVPVSDRESLFAGRAHTGVAPPPISRIG